MAKVSLKPEPKRRVQVLATDRKAPKGKRSKGCTIYGLTPTQVIDLVRKAVRDYEQEQPDAA